MNFSASLPDMLEYIADWLEKTVNETEDKEPDTMTYVAVLAKFSYLYQKYDVQYATQCLQHASAIYTKLAAASGRDAEKFMEGIRDQGEELAKRSGKMIDAVTSVNNGTEDLLKRAEELACANYILYSYQYTEILEDFLHYLMGRNRDSVCYYPEEGKTSDYLLLIAQQVSLTGKH
jgi:endoglucanase